MKPLACRSLPSLAAFLLCIGFCVPSRADDAKDKVSDYAVVVSKATFEDQEWKKVVAALVRRHQATVISYDGDVNKSREPLKKHSARYACFVARPEEAGREFVVAVNRLTRQLNDDPFTDVVWGILTGYRAEDALRIANTDKPLQIRKALSGSAGFDLSPFKEGLTFSESEAGVYWVKTADGKIEKKAGTTDSTKAIVDALNETQPDLVMTSGHATERGWAIGFSYKNGTLRCKDGSLFGLDLKGGTHAVRSPTPRIYLASGNCLMGHVADKQSMALAWMSGGGVNQMIGYTAVTFYGRGGWGTQEYFFDLPGRYTFAEAFFFNQQSIIHELQQRFPKTMKHEVKNWDFERDRLVLDKELALLGYRNLEGEAKDNLGLLWDRDAVAFYGDPAWEARLNPAPPPIRTELTWRDDVYTLKVTVDAEAKPRKPLAILMPHRVKDIQVMSGQELQPLVTPSFVMLMKHPDKFEKGKTYQLVFKAKRVETEQER